MPAAKLKLDENLGDRGADVLRSAGHDVSTVFEQQLTSAEDLDLLLTCTRENRCLVTLDLDFSNTLVFKPAKYKGIAVIRLPARPSHADLVVAVSTFAKALETKSIDGQLWIVERGRIREYIPKEEGE
jgi:predicted nuclease of predicted toxin-antitoxin system